ncbi:MAG: efflux RND transporter periplasmic adaptor subunit [Planctomycetes bacterium]|nr:efflux RND transporter periplasmic adaptor subunit [Planctomycetota bacterium]
MSTENSDGQERRTDRPALSREPIDPPKGRRGGVLRRMVHALPTLVVFAALGGLAYAGHHTGWRAPKFSHLFGTRAAAAEKEDWCAEHNVPESKCIACHPELAGGNAADWCKEHGVPESQCTVCHPEILAKGVAGDWCAEHGVPESGCTLCHPELAVKGEVPASDVTASVLPEPTATRPATAATKSAKDPRTCQTHARRVQFASPEAVRKAGLKLGAVVRRAMAGIVTANAEIQYDQTRVVQVAPRVSGIAWQVDKQVGDQVKKGDILALIGSTEVGRAKAEYLEAATLLDAKSKAFRRSEELLSKNVGSRASYEETEAERKQAEIRLFNARQALINLGLPIEELESNQTPPEQAIQFLGLPDTARGKLDTKETTTNLIPVTSPLEGVVTTRNVVAGEIVDTAKPLFIVADTTRMWVMVNVDLRESRRIALGQKLVFRPDGAPDEAATGKVTWISTAVDDQTRTLRVRADVENPADRLRAMTFGKAEITIRETPDAIAVPNEAIQWEGCCYMVFVRLADDIFQTRKVRLGAKDAVFSEVLAGVLPGEVVVTIGSHVLKSEILKSNLGAGCTDE